MTMKFEQTEDDRYIYLDSHAGVTERAYQKIGIEIDKKTRTFNVDALYGSRFTLEQLQQVVDIVRSIIEVLPAAESGEFGGE